MKSITKTLEFTEILQVICGLEGMITASGRSWGNILKPPHLDTP
jgi:hypothetical protein|tara:strand:- start:132 stop:263 length:132 start_codon:yes stop_codon:yes gene_type:complete